MLSRTTTVIAAAGALGIAAIFGAGLTIAETATTGAETATTGGPAIATSAPAVMPTEFSAQKRAAVRSTTVVRTNKTVFRAPTRVVQTNKVVHTNRTVIRRVGVGAAAVGVGALGYHGWKRWRYGGRYWNQYGYLEVAEPACVGYFPDGCRRRWVETEDGYHCVKYCPY